MTTLTMMPAARFGATSHAERLDPEADPASTNVRMLRAHAAQVIALARPGGETHRGKPPMVSVRLVVALQWVMLGTCALRIALGPL